MALTEKQKKAALIRLVNEHTEMIIEECLGKASEILDRLMIGEDASTLKAIKRQMINLRGVISSMLLEFADSIPTDKEEE